MDVKVLLLTLISLLDTVGCLPPIVIGRFLISQVHMIQCTAEYTNEFERSCVI